MSDAGPLPVSVIIAAYNRPQMTREAVLSALGQQPRPPAEVIVVDDCSTDDTGRAAEEAGARVIRHERNQGEGGARNTAMAAAQQPWLAMLDSDDEWLPSHLATLWPLRDDHVLVSGAALNVFDDGSFRYQGPTRWRTVTLRSPAALLHAGNFLPLSGTMVRADVVERVGAFDPALRWGADLDLWLRVLERGTGVFIPRPVVRYREHAGQVMQDRDAAAEAHLRVLRSYADRPWWSAARVEAWRGVVAWDEMRRELAAGHRASALRGAVFAARRPARVAGIAALLGRRTAMRHRANRLRAR